MNKNFSVWVGGFEVNDYYLTEEQAKILAKHYIENEYEDVSIEESEA